MTETVDDIKVVVHVQALSAKVTRQRSRCQAIPVAVGAQHAAILAPAGGLPMPLAVCKPTAA